MKELTEEDWDAIKEECLDANLRNEIKKANNSILHKGKKLSDETKKKISNTLLGKKLGPMSDETKAKLSAVMSGENNPSYNKKRSDETKEKMRLAKLGEKHPMYGKTQDEEYKLKKAIGNSKAWVYVGEVDEIFVSINAARNACKARGIYETYGSFLKRPDVIILEK